MSKDLFIHVCNFVKQHDRSFEQRRNCAGLLGHNNEHKVTAALRMMAYGVPANYIDDNLAMVESTSIFYVKQFTKTMVEVFGAEYLRAPDAQDTQRLLKMNKARGFPAWHGQFKGRGKDAIIILEAVADQETWFWHSYFGMHGSCNDINVLDRSPLFAKLANGEAPPVTFEANGCTYNYGYYLADGIYPRWSTFVKPIAKPQDSGIKKPFGIMTACVIMHNMIIENERGQNLDYTFYHLMGIRVMPMTKEERIKGFMNVYNEIRDSDAHDQRKKDLMEEHWKWHGESAV
ncbi:uncharacterized protein [Aegilops tauschii subsp. strangulata]|uniref:uncharacterized protein n=1 Tax=Aegilops tauschii subsp. strangulata TaxID=200361 RepID=UPI003CC8DD7C